MTNRITEQTFEKAGKGLEKLLFPVELGVVFVEAPYYPEQIPARYFKAVVAYKPDRLPEIFHNSELNRFLHLVCTRVEDRVLKTIYDIY